MYRVVGALERTLFRVVGEVLVAVYIAVRSAPGCEFLCPGIVGRAVHLVGVTVVLHGYSDE